MILITSANSSFGKNAINHLLKKSIERSQIIGLVESTTQREWLKSRKIGQVFAKYSDHNSLVTAFSGVTKVLLISETDLRHRGDQNTALVNAAREAGVKHIVYTSIDRKTDTLKSPLKFILKSHHETEVAIKKSGLSYTILRSSLYADILRMFLGEQIIETGVVFPANDGRVSFTIRSEVAEVAANILTSTGHENKEYRISNTEPISFDDIAEILSQMSGKIVPYQSPDLLSYIEAKYHAGFSYEQSSAFAMFAEGISQGEFEISISDFESLLGRKPTSTKNSIVNMFSGSW